MGLERRTGACFTSVVRSEKRRVADAKGEEPHAQVSMLPSVMLTGRGVRWVVAA